MFRLNDQVDKNEHILIRDATETINTMVLYIEICDDPAKLNPIERRIFEKIFNLRARQNEVESEENWWVMARIHVTVQLGWVSAKHEDGQTRAEHCVQ